MKTDDEIIEEILVKEGGFVNRREDKGGPTNWGITIATLREWRRSQGDYRPVTVEDVKALTKDEARTIYRHRYVRPWQWITDSPLRAFLVDSAVQHWHDDAIKFLQYGLGFRGKEIDGRIGPATRARWLAADPRYVLPAAINARLVYYSTLFDEAHEKDQKIFVAGWWLRLATFVEGYPR